MTDPFRKLPLELIFMILTHVPVPSLLSFGATSKLNYTYHTLCMRTLHLAVFRKRLQATLAFLGACEQYSPKEPRTSRHNTVFEHYRVQVVLRHEIRQKSAIECRVPGKLAHQCPPSVRHKTKKRLRAAPQEHRNAHPVSTEQTIRAQNKAFADIINRYGQSLGDLEFLAYNLNEEGAVALGTSCGTKLRHLALRFEHPYVRDDSLSQHYWDKPAPGSPAWNSLINIGPLKRGIDITNLESLVLERAGITPWQLRMLVSRNRRLKVLKLRTCAAIQPEFLNWLGGIPIPGEDEESRDDADQETPGASLIVLWIENADEIRTLKPISSDRTQRIDTGLEWLLKLKAVEVS